MRMRQVFFLLIFFIIFVGVLVLTLVLSRKQTTLQEYNILDLETWGNVPGSYFQDKPRHRTNFNETCAKHPDLFDLRFTSTLWQTQTLTNGTLHLFNAYYDHRHINPKDNQTSVRIVSMFDVFQANQTVFCQLRYEADAHVVVVKSDKFMWTWVKGWGGTKPGIFHPYLVTCRLPDARIPASISLVENACDEATNHLTVVHKPIAEDKKRNFVVCVKGLNFPFDDKSTRLIEWIELLSILGADKINFYQFSIHPTTKKVLDYYESRGLVETTPITLIGGPSNLPFLQSTFLKKKVLLRRLQEVIPYNDCLYKHLQEFKYVVLLDTDEVIVPVDGDWTGLIKTIQNNTKTSYMARNVYFLDNQNHQHEWFEGIPTYTHMLQHVYRAENYTKPGSYVKGFHDTRHVMALHNHFPFACLRRCSHLSIDTRLAHLQHYRSTCVKDVKNCEELTENSVMDARIWHYKDELISRVNRALDDLGLLEIVRNETQN